MRLEDLRDFSRTGDCLQTKRKGPVSRTLRQVLPCGFPLGLALRLALEGISLRSFLLLKNLPIISRRRKGAPGYESPVCGNKLRRLGRSKADTTRNGAATSWARHRQKGRNPMFRGKWHEWRALDVTKTLANPVFPSVGEPNFRCMINELFGRARETLCDAVDGAIEILTLGEYGYEPVPPAEMALSRSCEGRERVGYSSLSAGRVDRTPSSV